MSTNKRFEAYGEKKPTTVTEEEQQVIDPFIGPRPFRRDREDQKLFFGRDKETNEILSLIFAHQLVLIYAQSGAGKTSILNAQVTPALEKYGYNVLPTARVGIASETKVASKKFDSNKDNLTSGSQVNFYMFNALQSLKPKDNPQLFINKSLSEFLNECFPNKKEIGVKLKPQVLVFDQLEELFRFYPDDSWREQQEDFFKQVAEALEKDSLLRILFVIREDYLAELDHFVDMLPERLRPRFRLERLRKDAAFKAIKGPLERTSTNLVQPSDTKEINEQIEEIVNDLLKIRVEDPLTGKPQEIKGEFVEPIQLQVVCRRWWRDKLSQRKTNGQSKVKLEKSLTNVDRALREFYEEAIHEAVKRSSIPEDTIKRWFDEKFITTSGTRAFVHHKAFVQRNDNPKDKEIIERTIESLERSYVIRAEWRSGAKWYELTHDRLIGPINASNLKWKEQERNKKSRRLWTIAAAAIAVSIISFIIILYYFNMINNEPCSIPYATLTGREEGAPVDIAVNPNTNIVYVANSDSKNILAIDCNKQKIMIDRIPTNEIVKELAVDPTSNKVYAALQDNKSALVIESSNGLSIGIDDINEAANDLFRGEFDKVLYDSPHHSSPTVIKASAMPVAVNNSLKNETLQIAFNPNTGKIYAAYDKSDIISVIDSTTGAVLKNITGAAAAIGINSLIVNPDTNKIYVSNPEIQKISVIDGTEDSVIENIPVGTVPIDITVDSSNNMIYVAHLVSNTISIIDGNKDQVVQILRIPFETNVALKSIAVDAETHMLYLGLMHNDGSYSVSMLNPTINDDTYIQVAQKPLDLDVNVNNSKMYVAEYNNGSIAVINTNTDTLLDESVNLGQNRLPFNIAINPNTNKVYVANFVPDNNSSSIVSVIDSENSNVLKDVPFPFRVSDMAINTNSNTIYVVGGGNDNYNYLSIIDGRDDTKLENDIPIPFSPSDIAVNPNSNKIYLANNEDWSVTIINDIGDNVLSNATIQLSIAPESLVVDPDPEINRIYVTSYMKLNSDRQENSFDPTSLTFPRFTQFTQIQMIDGSKDTVGWDGKILKLDPKFGDLKMTLNPTNHNFLATSLSTDTILSWDDKKNEMAVASGFILSPQHQIPAGIDPSQIAVNLKGDKLYIVNPTLNAIKVENFTASK